MTQPSTKPQTIEILTPEQVEKELLAGAMLVDIRDERKRNENGRIEGSVHIPHEVLKSAVDPASPLYNTTLEKDKRIILHCSTGGRSPANAEMLICMGYTNLAQLEGGLKGWKESGRKVLD